uniref:2-oxoglutarate-dependent ethylene/succinate-forming enzyme n=1 Tax=uncultured Thiotrichaceae bacterium TaxID=298394 RepID=A0A6S6UF17_9GAMM|nr:MAG: Isopenicillin N synthase [uncultured Thiotrichaceae bacterium]
MALAAVDYQAESAAEAFVASLREYGFGVLKNHPIPESDVISIYQNWERFFASPGKSEWQFDPVTMDGFYPLEVSETAKGYALKDLKEYYHYFHPWGKCPPALKGELVAYREKAQALAAELLSWVEQFTPADVSAGFSEPLSQMIDGSEQTLLRVLHYPPLQGDEPEGAVRAAAHEDINLLTVLPAANAAGLQVLGRDGQWMDVPCDFGLLIVNTGDMLQEASGGYFSSTTHRVINPPDAQAGESRISLPLFLHPRPDVELSERHTARSYLTERLNELGFN